MKTILSISIIMLMLAPAIFAQQNKTFTTGRTLADLQLASSRNASSTPLILCSTTGNSDGVEWGLMCMSCPIIVLTLVGGIIGMFVIGSDDLELCRYSIARKAVGHELN